LGYYQKYAIKAGISQKDVERFTNHIQVEAFRYGASIEEALQFNYYAQIKAIRTGLKAEVARQFVAYNQVDALLAGISVKKSLLFKHSFQGAAMQSLLGRGISFECEIDNAYMTLMYLLGYVPEPSIVDLALAVDTLKELDCINDLRPSASIAEYWDCIEAQV
jgi:hypothetical protein